MPIRARITIALAVAALFLAALGYAPAQAQDKTAKIGVGLGITGPMAYLSQQYLNGMRAAVDEVNRSAGAGGDRKLELVVRDHKGIPAEAVTVAKRLIEEDRVDIVDIDLPSTVAIAAEGVTKQAKVPQIAGYTFSPAAVEQGNPYFFRACTNSPNVAAALAKAIHAQAGHQTIAMLAPNDDYGRSAIGSLKAAFEKQGAPRVVYEDYYDRTQQDFTAVLLKIKSVNPDSIYLDVRWPASVTALKQMAEVGLAKPLYGSVNFYNPKLIEQAGKYLEGTYLSVAWAPVFTDAASKTFIAAYQRLYKDTPDDSASLGWTAAMVAAKALAAAGPGADGAALREALGKLEWQSPQGLVKFNEKGESNLQAHVLQIRNGAYHLTQQ